MKETIKTFSRYYQNAIRSNKDDVETMETAIYATLFHSISTDQKPQHFKCPAGKDNWCFFQTDLAHGEVPSPHVKHVKTPLNETFSQIYANISKIGFKCTSEMHKMRGTKCKRKPSQHHMR
ncbi:uncharacterized protein TNCV_255701 [Trichonephila clavipes]|nr:uncharacterized protein TNCV_255701 [Trichonephila clavipes]